jgi:hypothetical protein
LDFELASPACFGNDIIWHIPPDQKVDANTTTSANFGKNTIGRESVTALIYRLQRKSRNSNNQPDTDSKKDTSVNIQLAMVWCSDKRLNVYVNTVLIKNGNVITWDENKLRKLYYNRRPSYRSGQIDVDEWLLDDAIVLVTTSKSKEGRTFEITISEGIRGDDSIEPLCLSSDM